MTLAATKTKRMSTAWKVFLAIGAAFLVLMAVKSVMVYYENVEEKRVTCEQARKVLSQMERDFQADQDAIQQGSKPVFKSLELSIRGFKNHTEKFCGPVE